MPTCPPDPIVEPIELSQWGVPGPFLAQFRPLPMQVQIATPGALGVMAFVFRLVGETNWSNTPIVSTAGSSWLWTIDDQRNVYANLTFAPGSYVASSTYLVDAGGVVTPDNTAIAGLSATRFDMRANGSKVVTDEVLKLVRNAITPPLLLWDTAARRHAAAMVYAFLKRSKGATAQGAGVGDENVFDAERHAYAYFLDIGENGRPDSWVDTSASTDGPLLGAYPESEPPRGWDKAY